MIVPEFLKHLPMYGEYPVPFTVFWKTDGKPDFRVVDPRSIMECMSHQLCGICGKKLGERSHFLGGDLCKEHHLFVDPPMHEPCVQFAIKTCPFLAGNHTYSERALPKKEEIEIIAPHSTAKLKRSWLLVSWTNKTKVVHEDGNFLFRAGNFIKQEVLWEDK